MAPRRAEGSIKAKKTCYPEIPGTMMLTNRLILPTKVADVYLNVLPNLIISSSVLLPILSHLYNRHTDGLMG